MFCSCFNGQNTGSWHKLSYYGTLMTGAAANATGLARYYNKAGIDNTVICLMEMELLLT